MKFKAVAMTLVVLAISVSAWCAPSAGSAFDSLKGLAGQWQAKDPTGKMQTITWKLVSAGTVLMESMQEESMVTMYHVDNDRLMLTHYCAAHNQPRMSARVSDDGKTYTFDFLDATNLPDPNAGHMRKLVLTLVDKDHYTEQWFFAANGKDGEHGTFEFTRKK